jgi:transcriptional regulator with XRE-family HTH domain
VPAVSYDDPRRRHFIDGGFLIAQRERVGISLSDVISRAGVAGRKVSPIEKGQATGIGVDFVSPLAAAYETSEEDLLLGAYWLTPEDSLMLDNAEALRIGRLVLSLDSDQREAVLSLTKSMTEKRPSVDAVQEERAEATAAGQRNDGL